MLSLIQLSNLADAMAYHANAARLLEPYAPGASAQHIKNARVYHEQIGKLLVEAGPKAQEAA